jgi:hypothetical protein
MTLRKLFNITLLKTSQGAFMRNKQILSSFDLCTLNTWALISLLIASTRTLVMARAILTRTSFRMHQLINISCISPANKSLSFNEQPQTSLINIHCIFAHQIKDDREEASSSCARSKRSVKCFRYLKQQL